MRFVTRAATLGAVLFGLASCSGMAPGEAATGPAPVPGWRPVPVEGEEPDIGAGGPSHSVGGPSTGRFEAEEPLPQAEELTASTFAGTRAVAARLIDAPADLELLRGFDGLRLDVEGLTEVSYPYPFRAGKGPLELLLRRLITVDHDAHTWDMRTGLLLPAGASLRWDPPAGEGRVLHVSIAAFPKAFQGRRAEALSLEILVADVVVSRFDLSGREPSTRWEEGTVPLPADAGAVTVRVSSPAGVGLKPGIGLADVHVTVPASDAADAPARLRQGPNLVVLFVDALRADCVGAGNPGFPSVTPFLDARAATGTTYTSNFTVSNQTRPSIVGFLQSQHPTVGAYHAKWWNFRKEKIDEYYAHRPPLLPLLLAQAGYETVTFGRNHFQFGTTLMGLDPGFDEVWDNRKSVEDTERIIDRAVRWLDGNHARKFLMLVNISPPHQPYKAPEEHARWTEARLAQYEGRLPARKDYLGEVRYADAALKRLVEHMDSLGLAERTIFLLTADHGEVMRTEHSCRSEVFETICNNSHGLTLYDEELRTPLIWWGWGVTPGVVHEHTVSHLDVAPTLLDAAGLPAHPAHTGLTLWDELRGEGSAADRPDVVYVESRLSSAVRAWGWKYILHHQKDDARTPAWNSGGESGQEELYDLTTDPDEKKNLVRQQDPRRKQLRQLLGETRTLYKDYVEQARDDEWNPETALPRPTPPIPGAGPAAAPSAATPEQGDRPGTAVYHLAFSGKGPEIRRFEGTIRISGRIADAEFLGPDGAFHQRNGRDGITVALDVAPGTEPQLRLRTAPPDAAVTLELTLDGAPVDGSRVYAGRDGLAILGAPTWGPEEAATVLSARTPPHRIPGEDLGVFVWRTGPRAAGATDDLLEEGDFEKERIVDPATRGILKDYGYWK
ncbi:MAG: sulfatase [Pseudomonadota bacterium]